MLVVGDEREAGGGLFGGCCGGCGVKMDAGGERDGELEVEVARSFLAPIKPSAFSPQRFPLHSGCSDQR